MCCICLHAQPYQYCTSVQVLADTAAADALAAKGASDVDAKQMQAMLRSLMAEALQSSSDAAVNSPTGSTQQAMLRYALARHGMLNSLMIIVASIKVTWADAGACFTPVLEALSKLCDTVL